MRKRNLFKTLPLILEKIPIISLIITIIGLLLICFPRSATAAVLRTSGVIILIYSIYRLIFVFLLNKDVFRTTLDFALAFFALIISVLLLADPLGMSSFISMLFGLFLIAESAFRLWSLAVSRARYEYFGMPIDTKSRAFKITFSVITLVIGTFLLIFPLATHSFVAVITGLCLVFEGVKGVIARIIEIKNNPDKFPSARSNDIEADFEDKTDEK